MQCFHWEIPTNWKLEASKAPEQSDLILHKSALNPSHGQVIDGRLHGRPREGNVMSWFHESKLQVQHTPPQCNTTKGMRLTSHLSVKKQANCQRTSLYSREAQQHANRHTIASCCIAVCSNRWRGSQATEEA